MKAPFSRPYTQMVGIFFIISNLKLTLLVLGTIICPSEYLTEKEVTRYPNGGTKKLFCHCSIKQEDIAPFKTCSVKFKTAPIIIPTCPPQVTCPAHNQNIVPKQDSLIGTQQHQDILCLIWAVVGLLIAMAVAQLLAIVLIVRLTVKKQVFNHDVIALTDSPSKRDDEEGVIIENDIYGTL